MNTIIQARIAEITSLARGSHDPDEGAMCAMEAVAYIAGEPWSDHPACACPVIATFMRTWNDDLPDTKRTALLLPLVPRLVGTKGSNALETRRSLMAADWLIRTHTAAWLRLAGLTAQADLLAALPEITDMAQVPSIRPAMEAVRTDAAAARKAAWAAAWDASGAVAWAASRAASREAAREAAWDAAWDAAWAAAGDATWAVAWAASGDVAWAASAAATRAKLAPVKAELQRSAIALIERMIDARDAA